MNADGRVHFRQYDIPRIVEIISRGRAAATLPLSGSGIRCRYQIPERSRARGKAVARRPVTPRPPDRGCVGHIAAEFLAQRRRVVRENLRAARDRDIGHAAVERVSHAHVGVCMDQHTVPRLALAGMAGAA